MKHIRLFNTLNERTFVVNDHPYDNILSYTKENDGLLISQSIPNDEIWYTSSDGNVVTPSSSDGFGATIISNTYTNGKGVIKFDAPVTSIGDYAFAGCQTLESITIPCSVTSIGESAFEESRLTSVTIPDSVATIGEYAFYGCTGLTTVTIPDSVTSIGDEAFYFCSGLTSVTIPDSVTNICNSAFAECSSLTSVNIPNTITSIGQYAFTNVLNINYNGSATGSPWGAKCINGYVEDGLVYTDNTKTTLVGAPSTITGSVIIPDSVITIGDYAFYQCRGLMSVTIPDSVTSISDYAFYECSSLTSVTIPDSVATIGECAFYQCIGLTSVTIPDSVTTIGSGAFFDDRNINYNGSASGSPWGAKCVNGYVENGIVYTDSTKTTLVGVSASITGSVIIPNGVTTISSHAFNGCGSLTSVTIPSSVTSIGDYAFYASAGLISITCERTTPPVLSDVNAFYATNNCPIYVPAASVNRYKTTYPWNSLASRIQAIQS